MEGIALTKKRGIQYLTFFLMLTVFSLAYNYEHILFFRPSSVHQWRQCDCLSITDNYYQENRSFCNPSVNWIGSSGTGETVSEFPVIYFFVAKLWKIFGEHEFIFRLVNLFIFYSGLYALFRMTIQIFDDLLVSVFLSFLIFTSPIVVYYANNFLADVPALSMSLIGWYFLLRFIRTERNIYLVAVMLCWLLGGLLKISSLLSFISLGILFILELNPKIGFKENRKIFFNPLLHGAFFLVVIVCIFLWYYFAINYNYTHNRNLFLTGILPIWELNKTEIFNIWSVLTDKLLWQFFSRPVFYLIAPTLLFCLIYYRYANRFLLSINYFLFVGFIVFFILFFKVFKEHDYYMINLIILPAITFINFFIVLKNRFSKAYHSNTFRIACMLFLSFNLYYASAFNTIKYYTPKLSSRYPLAVSKRDLRERREFSNYYDDYLKSYEKITPYLRSLGINRKDKVISLNDESINITLYLMEQKGFSDFGYLQLKGSERMEYFISEGAQYLVLNDPKIKNEEYLKPYLYSKIGQFNNIEIYDLRHLNKSLIEKGHDK
jgi:hypothetical protein